jgi:hypothetical protein
MTGLSRNTARTVLAVFASTAILGGCISYTKEVSTEKAVPVVVAASPSERVVTYPDGRYELHGDGARTPYYWVWIPAGNVTTPPPPPPIPVR